MDAQDVGHDVVHEAPVVGDEHDLPGPGHEKPLEPAEGGDVEIVAGFVEEEHLEITEEDLGQVQADLVAPGELGGVLVKVGGLEPEAGQDLLDAPELVVRVGGDGPGGLGPDRVPGKADPLLDVADLVVPGLRDCPLVRLILADDHPEKGGLAVAVPADDADPLAAVDLEADGVEEPLFPVALREVIDNDHGGRSIIAYRRAEIESAGPGTGFFPRLYRLNHPRTNDASKRHRTMVVIRVNIRSL